MRLTTDYISLAVYLSLSRARVPKISGCLFRSLSLALCPSQTPRLFFSKLIHF